MTVEPRRFARDVVWNVASLAVAGVCGVLLNILIGISYGPEALGIFNQVFALYILFSQIAVLGFQYSVLTYIAASDDPEERKAITTTALVITAGIALLFSLLLWALSGLVGDVLDSEEVSQGIGYTVPGLFFFALSKVSLACVNGLRRMRLYAIYFSGRFVLMIAAFGICAAMDVERATLPVILTIAEAATFLLSLPTIRRELGRVPRAAFRLWMRRHFHFGTRGLLSGVLTELNTRVDVLMLGAFTSDVVVGAYSFAAILAEGAYQLLMVLRTNYAPILIRLWAEGKRDELVTQIRRGRDRTYLVSAVVGAISVAGYIIFMPYLTADPELLVSWHYFAVLMAGIVASAGYAPFGMMLLYAKRPGWHTWLTTGVVLINGVGNLILIPILGAVGAAFTTATAFVAGAIALRVLCQRLLDLRI